MSLKLVPHLFNSMGCTLNSSMHNNTVLTGDVRQRRSAVHMDCMHWVNRDSYLPQGSRGLKVRTGACRHLRMIKRSGPGC
jgi:hypothetical protein